ncbi:ABC transporter permease [Alkalispirochaeta sphaeroplastigenens]|uniref:ABC transporter permease n=1 Tax=Alkalispirochaeta sphaeroplastigenens TaxID=1187066 RepID=A0A2S4JHU8_9SPIO|nr:ABC transporter permease [Alkalispirochaeta sphaeroplastigenens]POQ99083.1 ABC transporter permease [Alkalispirochaeta sphaeroplastigenens]
MIALRRGAPRRSPGSPGEVLRLLARPVILFREAFPLASFIAGRLFSMVTILFFVGLGVFGLMSLTPGDIVDTYVRSQMMMDSEFRQPDHQYTEEAIAAARARLGLDQPFYIQYATWLRRVVVERDLGRTLISRAPVLFLIRDRMINSLILNLISLFFLTIISFALGIYFSTKAGTRTDVVATVVALVLHAFPGLLLLILLQLFASVSGIFPITAYPDFPWSEAPLKFTFSYLHHILLPLIGAFLGGIGGTLRMIRATMLDQLGQPYITSLRSRGISEGRVYFAHAFRNTLNPYITSSANLLASLFSGSLILEIIFSYPGIGRLMFEAVRQEDVNLVLANIMFISFLVLSGMVISDILLALVDPRIKFGADR